MLNAIFLLWQHFTGELLEAIPSVKTEIGRCTTWNIRIIPTSALTSTPATITSAPLQSPILMATPQAFAWQLGDIQCLWSSLFSKPSAPSWPPDLVDTWATLIKHSCTLSLSHHSHSLCPQPVFSRAAPQELTVPPTKMAYPCQWMSSHSPGLQPTSCP